MSRPRQRPLQGPRQRPRPREGGADRAPRTGRLRRDTYRAREGAREQIGLDVAYDRSADDDELVGVALEQNRWLLTKDRGLLHRRAVRHQGAYVRGRRSGEQLADVLDRFAPRLRPWSRCPACNGELSAVAKDDVVGLLEPGTARSYHTFSQCVDCRQVFWRGAHSGRLAAVVDSACAVERRARS